MLSLPVVTMLVCGLITREAFGWSSKVKEKNVNSNFKQDEKRTGQKRTEE